ncbi:SSU ribosomal protein S20P [Anaerobranca californiensis DSM 14826]|jgi:small subunit ribosomal protein S20|uniref:Small ribosomal subunit protein bS20 n=1 Tax=Anaerobranca californiensis DSM 14826 TaxID=1120989 RepID=A0A1M6NG85_9FIRM|nr:30S ribosomal protein S20 [Anaerobranca californiensis]SHJ94707.1 SSU ribosomal protein S20P [Anaerobranca californiensis DSM 14826]
MPNIKSAKKRVKIIAKKTARNTAIKSYVKTMIKKYENAVAAGDKELAQTAFVKAVKALDKAVSKGVLHKNTASRKKSRLAKKLKVIA